MSEIRSVKETLQLKGREQQSRLLEQSNTIDALKAQISDLTAALKTRDASVAKEMAARRQAETEVERLHTRVEESQKALESNKPKGSENNQLEALRVQVLFSGKIPRMLINVANRTMRCLSKSIQKHRDSLLWACFLQAMCR